MLGRAVGKEERLACLSWAYEDWRTKEAVKEVLAQLAQQRKAEAAQTSAPASDEGTARPPLDPSPSTDNTARSEAGEPPAHDDEAELAETARLTAEATELIAAIKTRCNQDGCHAFDEELARARALVRVKSLSEGVEVTERALRAVEIDFCRHRLEMIRASGANMEAIKARHRRNVLWREAERQRKLDRGVPRTMPGVHPRYRLP